MERYIKCASLIKRVSKEVTDERAAKCGYDLMYALANATEAKTMEAWERYLQERKDKQGHADEERNGVWVPAILLT